VRKVCGEEEAFWGVRLRCVRFDWGVVVVDEDVVAFVIAALALLAVVGARLAAWVVGARAVDDILAGVLVAVDLGDGDGILLWVVAVLLLLLVD
jgi:hypothetical protein